MEGDSSGFEVSLRDEFLSIPGTYYYSVQATANGGASAISTYSILISPELLEDFPIEPENVDYGDDVPNFIFSESADPVDGYYSPRDDTV